MRQSIITWPEVAASCNAREALENSKALGQKWNYHSAPFWTTPPPTFPCQLPLIFITPKHKKQALMPIEIDLPHSEISSLSDREPNTDVFERLIALSFSSESFRGILDKDWYYSGDKIPGPTCAAEINSSLSRYMFHQGLCSLECTFTSLTDASE